MINMNVVRTNLLSLLTIVTFSLGSGSNSETSFHINQCTYWDCDVILYWLTQNLPLYSIRAITEWAGIYWGKLSHFHKWWLKKKTTYLDPVKKKAWEKDLMIVFRIVAL